MMVWETYELYMKLKSVRNCIL